MWAHRLRRPRHRRAARRSRSTRRATPYVVGNFDGEIDRRPARQARSPATDDVRRVRRSSSTPTASRCGRRRSAASATTPRTRSRSSGDTIVVVGNFLDEIKIGEFRHKSVGSDDLYVAAFDQGRAAVAVDRRAASTPTARTRSRRRPTAAGSSAARSATSSSSATDHAQVEGRHRRDAASSSPRAGDVEWVKQFGGHYNDTISHVAIDRAGQHLRPGHVHGLARLGRREPLKAGGGSDNDVVLAKYDANGDHLWSQRFGDDVQRRRGRRRGRSVGQHHDDRLVRSHASSFGAGDEHTLARRVRHLRRALHHRRQARVGAARIGADREDIALGHRGRCGRQHRHDRLVPGHGRFRQGRR